MPIKEIFKTLYAYNAWANQKIFDAAQNLAAADFSQAAVEGQRKAKSCPMSKACFLSTLA